MKGGEINGLGQLYDYGTCTLFCACGTKGAFLFTDEPSRKKRKSRWGSESVKTVLPGLPTSLPANMSEEQQKLYLCEGEGQHTVSN